jgi:hypothetical protein
LDLIIFVIGCEKRFAILVGQIQICKYIFLTLDVKNIVEETPSGGHAWQHVFMACSKLEAMAIYLVKQACGNDILASV